MIHVATYILNHLLECSQKLIRQCVFSHNWAERDVQQDLLLHCCSATGTHIKYGSDPFSLLRAQPLCWTDKHSHTHTCTHN